MKEALQDRGDGRPPTTVCLVPISGFALMSYASVVEPLRAANVLSGRTLYRWLHTTPDGAPAVSSSGLAVPADAAIDAIEDVDAVIVVAAHQAAGLELPDLFAWLRRLAAKGIDLGGVSGGPFVLAQAGVLAGYRCTVHWDHYPAFVERFPQLEVSRSLYEIDRTRFTCAGGIAGLDMIHAMIAKAHGRTLAAEVSDWFLSTQVRPGERPQRLAIAARYNVTDGKLIAVLGRMESALEEPIDREELAAGVGISLRQLERLFRRKLGVTIKAHYLSLRLDRAYTLLTETPLSVSEVAVACGFTTLRHFSETFRKRYGRTPSALRQSSWRAAQS